MFEDDKFGFIELKEKTSDCEAGICFLWLDTDKNIEQRSCDRCKSSGFWRCEDNGLVLFGTARFSVTYHIGNIFKENESDKNTFVEIFNRK